MQMLVDILVLEEEKEVLCQWISKQKIIISLTRELAQRIVHSTACLVRHLSQNWIVLHLSAWMCPFKWQRKEVDI